MVGPTMMKSHGSANGVIAHRFAHGPATVRLP